MPFSGHPYRALTPEEASPFGNIIQNMMRDYQNAVKASYTKPTLAEELKKAQLANKKSALALSQSQLASKYLPAELEAKARLRDFKLKHPYTTLPGTAGQIASLLAMSQDPEMMQAFGDIGINNLSVPGAEPSPEIQAPPRSQRLQEEPQDFTGRLSQLLQPQPEPQNYVEQEARGISYPVRQDEAPISTGTATTNPYAQAIQSLINKQFGIKPQAMSNTAKEINELEDINAGFKPGTNRTIRLSPGQQEIQRKGLEAKIGGLSKGHFYIHDDNGNVVGESRPKTQKEKDIDRGTVLFDIFYPEVNKGLNYYSGFDSISRLENDAKNYHRDKDARQRFDDFLLAYKLRTVTGVNEAARFGAGRTNQTYNRFFDTLTDLDVPRTVQKLIKNFQVLNKANIKAGNRFHNILTKAQKTYEKNAQPNVNEYYPGMAPQSSEDPWGIQ